MNGRFPLKSPSKVVSLRPGMTMTFTEREPLLQKKHDRVQSTTCGPLDIPPHRRQRILCAIWIAQFLSALNLTLVPTMLPAISSEFQKSNEASWIGTSYLLATCTFTPLYGRLSDAMGRRGANHSAVLFAAAGILACGCSPSMEMLIISRFISGIGGGGIFTVSGIITSDMYNLRTRGLMQSIGGVFYGLGMGLGGPIGGLITDCLGWRWAFLLQIPLFAISIALSCLNLHYATPGNGKSTLEILKKIDYGGSACLFMSVGSILYFLSTRYNEGLEWSHPYVFTPLLSSIFFLVLFLFVEARLAYEPILPTYLLRQKVPFLIGCSNAFVAVCNLSITYFFPTWFQTVMLESAGMAGLHLLPNSVCISTGSVFAGWMMRRTGQYKLLNLVFGILPLIGAILIRQMREDSSPAHLWFSIIPLGFGNAVVLQTMYIALVASLPSDQLAVGTGFAQLVRGLGQVGGLAASSAIFQSRLTTELQERIQRPGAGEIINRIRHSARIISSLPPDLQRIARDAYGASLKSVFTLAVCASAMAFLCRLPIPDANLDDSPSSTRKSGPLSSDGDDENKTRDSAE